MNEELTVRQASERSGYSSAHICWLVRMDRIKARQIGQRVLLVEAESLTDTPEK